MREGFDEQFVERSQNRSQRLSSELKFGGGDELQLAALVQVEARRLHGAHAAVISRLGIMEIVQNAHAACVGRSGSAWTGLAMAEHAILAF